MSEDERIIGNTDCGLKYIGNLITDGFTSGYYPYWKLSLAGVYHGELSDTTLNHISKLVAEGYVAGEVIENYKNQVERGWWKLHM